MAEGQTLADLIDERYRDLGLSFEKLTSRARDQGYTLTKTTLSKFRNHALTEAPDRRTMEAVGVALGVSYNEVVMAVARSLLDGGPEAAMIAEDQRVRPWVTITAGMSDEQVAHLLRVARTVAEAMKATPDGASDGS